MGYVGGNQVLPTPEGAFDHCVNAKGPPCLYLTVELGETATALSRSRADSGYKDNAAGKSDIKSTIHASLQYPSGACHRQLSPRRMSLAKYPDALERYGDSWCIELLKANKALRNQVMTGSSPRVFACRRGP